MKKNLIVLLITALLSGGCNVMQRKGIYGCYKSNSRNLGVTELIAQFNSDHTFTYIYAHFPDTIAGEWETRSDTLLLYAEVFKKKVVSLDEVMAYFINNPDSINPLVAYSEKYTAVENKDAYIIKRNKLFPIGERGIDKECYLLRCDE